MILNFFLKLAIEKLNHALWGYSYFLSNSKFYEANSSFDKPINMQRKIILCVKAFVKSLADSLLNWVENLFRNFLRNFLSFGFATIENKIMIGYKNG